MRLLVLAALYLNIIGVANCQSDLTKTGGFRNGRVWLSLDESSKTVYLFGMSDGAIVAAFALPSGQKACEAAVIGMSPQGFTTEDYLKVLDDFYKEPANIRIPIVFAYRYATKRLTGTGAKQLGDMETHYRTFGIDQK